MLVPNADFIRPSNQEGTQQNLIDSGLKVLWPRLGGTSIALSSLEIYSAASCPRDGMPSQITASERINSERASGADRSDEGHRTPIPCGSTRTLAPTLRRVARSRRFTTPIFAPRLPRAV
jgi:hypothetical protein